MAYATRTQLTQLGLPSTALTNVPTATQDAALEAASDRIDSYLRGRYSVPLESPTDDIVEACCVLAAFRLLTTKGHNPTFFDQTFADQAAETLQWLKDLGSGKANLDPSIDASPETHEGAPLISSRGPTTSFGSPQDPNTPRGW